jgi:hypothetical protein
MKPSTLRRSFEWSCRAIALASILWGIIAGLAPASRVTLAASDLGAALPRWTFAPPTAVGIRTDRLPSATDREWIRGLRRDGVPTRWAIASGVSLIASAMSVEPRADPAGVLSVEVAAPRGSRVVVSDALGPVDSAIATNDIARFRGEPHGSVRALVDSDRTQLVGGSVDSLITRRVLVVGDINWESKFVTRALEERGWHVDVRLTLRPNVGVDSRRTLTLDTAQYAAVIAVGSTGGVSPAEFAGYVHSGGGLVLAGGAERAVPELALGSTGATRLARPAIPDSAPRSALELVPVLMQRAGATALERSDTAVAVAIAREDSGRVAQVGYRDTWRWRMLGAGTASEAHREWWASLVAAVAYAPAIHRPVGDAGNPAPYASWIDAMGPATSAPPSPPVVPAAVLFSLAIAALLAETLSRRLRGAA